jgi:uncharacterized membrane protein
MRLSFLAGTPASVWKKAGLVLALLVLAVIWLRNTPPGLLGKADATAYAVCHRIDARSFHLGERALPLCVRCSGMYLGAVLGLVFLAVVSPRRGGIPPTGMLIVLGFFTLAFIVDGFNSFLHLIPGMPSLYTPQNSLRMLTGMGMGLVLALMTFVAFNQTVWRGWDSRPVFGSWRSFISLVSLAILLSVLVLTESPLFLFPLAYIGAAGVWLILTLVYTVVWLVLSRQENRWESARSLVFPLLVGLTLGLLQIMVFDALRFALTGTWEGFHFG